MQQNGHVAINGSRIGSGHPCFIIAEIGSNHDGNIETAKDLIRCAADAGADAVKFQSFTAESLVAASEEETRTAIRAVQLDPAWYDVLNEVAAEQKVVWLSTAFDETSAEELATRGMPAFKVASGDLTDHAFLQFIARFDRPIILSTGMATLKEVEAAVTAIRHVGNPPLVLLHCVAAYPASPDEANIRAMVNMGNALNVAYGYSDHCLGLSVPLGAVALGACVIEKHFTTDRTLTGPDHGHSLEVSEFTQMVKEIRNLERALGTGVKVPSVTELGIRRDSRRGLYAATDIQLGQSITPSMVARLRPCEGLGAEEWEHVMGRVARVQIPEGAPLLWALL